MLSDIYAECRYAECRGALSTVGLLVLTILNQLLLIFQRLFTIVQATFNEEVNCIKPSHSVGVPWCKLHKMSFFKCRGA